MRLIDADELKKALAEMWYENNIRITGLSVAELIDDAPTIEPSGDLVSRQLLIGAIEKCGEEKIYPQALIETIKALPSADRPTIKQTDTIIIADALRYLVQDTERHELDRTRAEELRKQILQYGASMCHSADRPKGEWKWTHGGQCSECGFYNTNFNFNFCPNCGADMQLDK